MKIFYETENAIDSVLFINFYHEAEGQNDDKVKVYEFIGNDEVESEEEEQGFYVSIIFDNREQAEKELSKKWQKQAYLVHN